MSWRHALPPQRLAAVDVGVAGGRRRPLRSAQPLLMGAVVVRAATTVPYRWAGEEGSYAAAAVVAVGAGAACEATGARAVAGAKQACAAAGAPVKKRNKLNKRSW